MLSGLGEENDSEITPAHFAQLPVSLVGRCATQRPSTYIWIPLKGVSYGVATLGLRIPFQRYPCVPNVSTVTNLAQVLVSVDEEDTCTGPRPYKV